MGQKAAGAGRRTAILQPAIPKPDRLLSALAAQRGVPRAQLALAWLLQTPGVAAPIIGASRPQHLTDVVAALSVKLSAEERAALEAPYQPHPVVGFE